MRTGHDSPGTGAKDYQDTCNPPAGGDHSNGSKLPEGNMKTVMNGGKASNPASATKADTGNMRPDFYPGAVTNKSGSQR